MSTLKSAICSLRQSGSAKALQRFLAAEAAELSGAGSSPSEGLKVANIGVSSGEYRWYASPERGMILDQMFASLDASSGHNSYHQLTPSKEERAQVRMDSTSSSSVHIDALTFGQIPPRAVSTLFKQIHDLGGMQNELGTFLDLGSGDGLVSAAAMMCAPFKNALGIEIVPSLYKRSQILAETWNASISGNEPNFKDLGPLSFELADLRESDRYTSASVAFVNAPCFDEPLMHTISQKASQMLPGSLLVSVGKPLRSECFNLVHKVRLPANGLGLFGETENDADPTLLAAEIELLDEEDKEASAAGLFTFSVYQRTLDDTFNTDATMLKAFTDTETQQIIREESCILHMLELLTNPSKLTSQDECISERAAAALALRSCLESEPSLRESIGAGIVPAAFKLLKEKNVMPLQVCGVLLLSSLSSHCLGQSSMIAHSEDMKESLSYMLLRNDAPTPVVDAGVEVAFNLSSSPEGCNLMKDMRGIPKKLEQLAKSSGGVDNTLPARSQATCERLEIEW